MTICRRALTWGACIVTAVAWAATTSAAETTDTVRIRDHQQTVHLYGTRGGTPAIVSSGDGGWIHLGPHVADRCWPRAGISSSASTSRRISNLHLERRDAAHAGRPGPDYRALIDYAARGSSGKPILVGVSEGAGLSVLAAGDAATKTLIGGVVALGLPDVNELGWRWKDSLIYVTHGVPKEPTFMTRDVVAAVAPLPLAAIHSTNDEFVPVSQARELLALRGVALDLVDRVGTGSPVQRQPGRSSSGG